MKKFILVCAMLVSGIAVASGQTAPDTTKKEKDKQSAPASADYQRPDAETRRNRYFKSLFGPVTLARITAGAGFGTIRNSPEEWEKSAEGFGRRFASNFGENVIRQSTMFGLDEALKLDSNFYRSKKRDLGSKVSNAFLSTFTARNSKGKRVLGVPRIAGAYVSHVVSREVWYPGRYNYKDGLKSGSISLGINVAVNLFRELIRK